MNPPRRAAAALLITVAAPAAASAHGGAGQLADAQATRTDWATAWNIPWVELTLVAVALTLYAVRANQLGPRLPRWRALSFLAGLTVLLLAGASPIDAVGERGLFSVHMLQHMLIGDLAAFLLVLGVTGPVLQPALRYRPVQRLRVLTHPMIACAAWAAVLIFWHIPVMYQASLRHESVHSLEHASFLIAGILMWIPLLEALPAPEWFGTSAKLGYIAGIRVVDAVIAGAFLWAGRPFYSSYEQTAPLWGISALQDQGYAGAVMMGWTATVTVIVGTVLLHRMTREKQMRRELIRRGVDPTAVHRAVRYGRGDTLAARHGVVLGRASPPAGPAA